MSHGPSLSLDQAATLLHCSRRTIYNRIREGRLPTFRVMDDPKGSQRILLVDVQAFTPPYASHRGRRPAVKVLADPVGPRHPEEDVPLPFPGSRS